MHKHPSLRYLINDRGLFREPDHIYSPSTTEIPLQFSIINWEYQIGQNYLFVATYLTKLDCKYFYFKQQDKAIRNDWRTIQRLLYLTIHQQINHTMEFVPFDPFPIQIPALQNGQSNKLIQRQSEFDLSSSSNNPNSMNLSRIKDEAMSQASSSHNMIKQLILTIKQMMKEHINNIKCAIRIKKIIQQAWKIFYDSNANNKLLLMAMFRTHANRASSIKMGFGQLTRKYDQNDIDEAIGLVKTEMLLRMKKESIRAHLLRRKLQHKQQLTAYILYFLEQQLKNGRIAYRLGATATLKIEQIRKRMQNQDLLMDCLFDHSEQVLERFSSHSKSNLQMFLQS